MKWIFQRFLFPSNCATCPDSVCGMLRISVCGILRFTVRHAPDYAPRRLAPREEVLARMTDLGLTA